MPRKPRITKEMILDAAFDMTRELGAEAVNARSLAARLNCSTQPILYWFAHVEDIRRAVYRRADEMHSAALMDFPPDADPMTALGLNYIRFAATEKPLFRLLFQSDSFQGQCVTDLVDAPELLPVLAVFQQKMGIPLEKTKKLFQTLFLLVHGYASLLANNAMPYDEGQIITLLQTAFGRLMGITNDEEEPTK